MNIHSAIIEATNVLKDKSILSAQLDTEILMAKALDKDREYIICLLYTSPSPRDRTRSRMPSSA